MDINSITIGQAKEIVATLGFSSASKEESAHPYRGKKVLVRTYASGVHIGTLKSYDSQTRDIFLCDSQRIHQWSGAFTLSKVATEGIKDGRISCVLPEIFITQVEEIILLKEEALKSIAKVGVHGE